MDITPSGSVGRVSEHYATTNIIESPQEGVRRRTRRVTRWRDGKMVLGWVASSFLDAEKSFHKIMGYRDLWMLQAILNPQAGLKRRLRSTMYPNLFPTTNYARDILVFSA